MAVLMVAALVLAAGAAAVILTCKSVETAIAAAGVAAVGITVFLLLGTSAR